MLNNVIWCFKYIAPFCVCYYYRDLKGLTQDAGVCICDDERGLSCNRGDKPEPNWDTAFSPPRLLQTPSSFLWSNGNLPHLRLYQLPVSSRLCCYWCALVVKLLNFFSLFLYIENSLSCSLVLSIWCNVATSVNGWCLFLSHIELFTVKSGNSFLGQDHYRN